MAEAWLVGPNGGTWLRGPLGGESSGRASRGNPEKPFQLPDACLQGLDALVALVPRLAPRAGRPAIARGRRFARASHGG